MLFRFRSDVFCQADLFQIVAQRAVEATSALVERLAIDRQARAAELGGPLLRQAPLGPGEGLCELEGLRFRERISHQDPTRAHLSGITGAGESSR